MISGRSRYTVSVPVTRIALPRKCVLGASTPIALSCSCAFLSSATVKFSSAENSWHELRNTSAAVPPVLFTVISMVTFLLTYLGHSAGVSSSPDASLTTCTILDFSDVDGELTIQHK